MRINQLALALLHLFGKALPLVWRDSVMVPLGASDDWQWRGYDDAWVELPARAGRPARRVQSVPGGSHWGGGVSIGARDQARIGQLLLDRGAHAGRRIVAADWIDRLTLPCAIAPFYGLLFWLNRDGRAFAGASRASSFMLGAGGHMTWVEPEHDAVVVVRWLDPAHTPGFLRRIGQALARAG